MVAAKPKKIGRPKKVEIVTDTSKVALKKAKADLKKTKVSKSTELLPKTVGLDSMDEKMTHIKASLRALGKKYNLNPEQLAKLTA